MNNSKNGENQGELKISLELFSKKILQSKEIESLEPELVEQLVKIINKYSFLFAQKGIIDGKYLIEYGKHHCKVFKFIISSLQEKKANMRIKFMSWSIKRDQPANIKTKESELLIRQIRNIKYYWNVTNRIIPAQQALCHSISSKKVTFSEQQNTSNLIKSFNNKYRVGQNTLAKKIFKYCLKRFYDQEVEEFQDRYDNIRRQIDKKDGQQQSTIPSQLQQNFTMNQKIQNGILLNNLSSIYLSEKKYEKALYLATSCSYDLEGYVFEQREIQDTEELKKDPEFKQRIIILLNSYLNMGRAQENIGRLIKDVQEYSTKFLYFEQAIKSYVNGCKFSKTYLGIEDRSFFSIFQGLLNQLRKEKEENYVKSFQSHHQAAYGSGYLDLSIEKRLIDFLNIRKRIENDKQLLNNIQVDQYQIATERPGKHFHIGKPKRQTDLGNSSSCNGFKTQYQIQNTSLRGNMSTRTMIQSPQVAKQHHSLSSSQQLFQNTQKSSNQYVNSKRQITLQNEQQNTNNNHNTSTISNNNNNNIIGSNQINNNITNPYGYQGAHMNTNNQNNSLYSQQDEMFNFYSNNNNTNNMNNVTNNNQYVNSNQQQQQQQSGLLNQRQFSVPNISNPTFFNKNIINLQNGQQNSTFFEDTHRNSTPLVHNPQALQAAQSSNNSVFGNLQMGQQIYDQNGNTANGVIPMHLLQQQSSQSPHINQLLYLNQQQASLNQQQQLPPTSTPNQQPFDNYFTNTQFSPINQISSVPNISNQNPFSYNILPNLNSQPQSNVQYNLNNQFLPQSQEQQLLLLQQQQQSLQAAAMQGLYTQQPSFMNQNFFSDNSHPVFQVLPSQTPIDPNLFEKNTLMDDQSDKGDEDIASNQTKTLLKNNAQQSTSKNESKKTNQTPDTAISNKASENSFNKKEKDNSNESKEIKARKHKEKDEKINQIQDILNQQNEKIRLLENQLTQQKPQRKSEHILYDMHQSQNTEQQQQQQQTQKVQQNVKQQSSDKQSSLKNIQLNQIGQDKKPKPNSQNGQAQTNSSNTNGINQISTLSSIGYDASPDAASRLQRGTKSDFKVTINNEAGSEVIVTGTSEQEIAFPAASFHPAAAAAAAVSAQTLYSSSVNSSINNKGFLKSGQSSGEEQSQNTLSSRNQQMNRILEEDSYDTSISPNMRQTGKSSHQNSNNNSAQQKPAVSPLVQVQVQQKQGIQNSQEKKLPILRNRRSSKSLDNTQNLDEEVQNKQQLQSDIDLSTKIKNGDEFSPASQEEYPKREPFKKKTLLQKHKSVNFQDDNTQSEMVATENNQNMYSSVEKRMKQNSVHSQTYTTLVTSPTNQRKRYDLKPNQSNNVSKKIPNIEEMMKNGAKKAHAWKLIEVSGECYRINVDLNEEDITLWASHLKTQYQIAKQIISLGDLQTLLEYVEYSDVLPNQKPLKSIATIEDVLTHFILPFMTIQDNKVSLQPRPIGLVEKDWQLKFLNTECDISFHHIIGNQFRIIFTCIHRKDQFKVDLELDDQVKADLFENLDETNKYLDKIKDIINLSKKKKQLLDMSDDEIASLKLASNSIQKKPSPHKNKDDEEEDDEDDDQANLFSPNNLNQQNVKDFGKFLDKYDKNRIDLITVESLRIKQLSEFTQIFIREIENIENFLQKDLVIKDINLFNLRFSNKILKLYVYKDELKRQIRGKITYVYEDQGKQVFCIKIKNTFETFAPNDTKEYAKGNAEIKFVDLWKEYGVQYDTLDASDKICICNFISKQYYIYTFEKKLESEDDGRYNSNLIKKKNLITGSYQRILIGPKFHKQVVTMTYMGLEDEPLGIKVTIYDQLRCEEKGILITVEDKFYKKTQAELDHQNLKANGQKKRTKKYKDQYLINSHFHLPDILKAFGWKILLEIIQVLQDKINRIYNIKGPLIGDKNTTLYRFESLMNPQNIIKFFQTKNMYLFQNPN